MKSALFINMFSWNIWKVYRGYDHLLFPDSDGYTCSVALTPAPSDFYSLLSWFILGRPWLFDDFDAWLSRVSQPKPYKCAVIFCDNSGVDIILGIFPFAQQLLSMGTSVSDQLLNMK